MARRGCLAAFVASQALRQLLGQRQLVPLHAHGPLA
jgi:hypothetical protein